MISSFWIILAALGVYGVIHSLIASLAAKDFTRRILGSAADRFYRLVFSLLGGITFLPVLVSHCFAKQTPTFFQVVAIGFLANAFQ